MNRPDATAKSTVRGLVWVAAGFAALMVLRNAWLCDDAFITLRSVSNLIHGRGITWNPGQRVQAFTHPLWFGVLSGGRAVSGETYYMTLCVSLVLALVSLVWLARRSTQDGWAGVLVLLALGCSKAFVDFSTSGLENVLTHVLLVAWLDSLRSEALGGERKSRVDRLTGLLLLTRLDLAVLVGPGYAWALWRRSARAGGPGIGWRNLSWAAGPQLAWMVFSLGYFGLLWPNTAYAKLNVSIPVVERVAQAGFYMLAMVVDDPVTVVLLLAGLGVGLRAPEAPLRVASAGIAVYLAYLVWIGGDFMLGRFFSAPLVVAAMVLLTVVIDDRHLLACCAVLGLCTLATPAPPWLTGRAAGDALHVDVPVQRFRDVTDERRFYFRDTGLIHALRGDGMPKGAWPREGRALAETRGRPVWAAGIRGFFAGPEAWLVDVYALTDPFLAQHRIVPLKHWKSGHYPRDLPQGYQETVESGENQLVDPAERRLYDDLVLATQAPLGSEGRLAAIWRLNTGADELPLFDQRNPTP